MSAVLESRSLSERALEILQRSGNPFRNYFARNPDDEVCARYHVPELFAAEREILLGVVDLYRYDPTTHSEIVPILGNKGAGKTHLLHSIKHGSSEGWQLHVTPGTYQKDTDFLEYLLFQVMDTLLGGGKQKGVRPISFVGEALVRSLLADALSSLSAAERLELFPVPGLGRWARKLGLGGSQAQERTQWLLDQMQTRVSVSPGRTYRELKQLCSEAGLEPEKACELIGASIERAEAHDTAGMMRRHIKQGFARAILLGDEGDLASFLTYGFAELEFQVKPSRQVLVLSLFKVLMELFLDLRIPVVVAFDQLEDLLLARRTDDGHRMAEAFFAGIVHVMHQVDGLCFLVFAERGLWNRFIPSLDGYIQDRLNNPIHVPHHGTLTAIRLEAPPVVLVRRVVETRLRPALEELPEFTELSPIFPFTEDQLERVARTEPTLRDMLQQFRHLFDFIVYKTEDPDRAAQTPQSPGANRLPESGWPATVKSVIVVENPNPGQKLTTPEAGAVIPQATPSTAPAAPRSLALEEIWDQEMQAARDQLNPEGSLTGATREMQAGLGKFLQVCHDYGVKVGPWRLQHVVGEWSFGEHPTYGVMTIAHWVCKDGQPWKVGVGLFMGRGPAKPKDLAIKLSTLEMEPPLIDHLILLRPEDDLNLSGKSKSLWQEAQRRGHHARLEAVSLDHFAVLYGLPRFLAAVAESQAASSPPPPLTDLLQEKCEKLLEQVCMPVQGG